MIFPLSRRREQRAWAGGFLLWSELYPQNRAKIRHRNTENAVTHKKIARKDKKLSLPVEVGAVLWYYIYVWSIVMPIRILPI